MSEVLITNIFFTITAIAVIIITAGVIAVLWFVVPIVRDLRDVVRKVRTAGEKVERDFESLRLNLKEEGNKSKAILDAGLGFIARKVGRRQKSKHGED